MMVNKILRIHLDLPLLVCERGGHTERLSPRERVGLEVRGARCHAKAVALRLETFKTTTREPLDGS